MLAQHYATDATDQIKLKKKKKHRKKRYNLLYYSVSTSIFLKTHNYIDGQQGSFVVSSVAA